MRSQMTRFAVNLVTASYMANVLPLTRHISIPETKSSLWLTLRIKVYSYLDKIIFSPYGISNFAYLSPSPQFGQVQATRLRCCLFGSLSVTGVLLDWYCCAGGAGVLGAGLDCMVCTICHFEGSFPSMWTVGAVTIWAPVAVVGIVCTEACCRALAGITWTLPNPGMFWTGNDWRNPLVVFIPVDAGWSCIRPFPTPLIMPPWVVKFVNAEAGISVNCCPWAPRIIEANNDTFDCTAEKKSKLILNKIQYLWSWSAA